MIGTQGWLVEHAIVCRVSECYPSLKLLYPVWENHRIQKCRNKNGARGLSARAFIRFRRRSSQGAGRCGGGCAKHWYLPRFPAIKVLKPLYTALAPKSVVFDQLSKLHVVVFWVAKECCVLHICYVSSQ